MIAEIKPISGVDDRIRLADVVPLQTPFTFNVFPTNYCNFRCNYCAQSLGASKLEEEYGFIYETMPLEVFSRAVEQMKRFSEPFKLLSFMGHGEPLLNQDLPKMIHLVKESGVAQRIEIITNASMLSHDLSKSLIEAGLSTLRVSLQGVTSEKYKKIANVNVNFEELLGELEYFSSIRKNCKLFVKVVDTSLEEGEEQCFYKLFENVADRMYVERIQPVYAGVDYKEHVRNIVVDRYGNEHEKRMVCPLTFYMMSLWPNGDIVPCDAIYKPLILGNVQNEELLTMWNGLELKEFQRMQLAQKRNLHMGCCRCCAPDDVSHPLDVLDGDASEIMKKYEK